jgi:hypothetical protein
MPISEGIYTYFVNAVEDAKRRGLSKASIKLSTKIKLLKDAYTKDNDWYVPAFGWEKMKLYFPQGLTHSTLHFTCAPNSVYRIHSTFKAEGGKIDHVNYSNGPILNTVDTYERIIVSNSTTLSPDISLINNSNGGWLYIDMVEDTVNNPKLVQFGDVNPMVKITITYEIGDFIAFDSWKNSVSLLKNNDPADAITQLTIVEKTKPNSGDTIRVIMMDTADNTDYNYTGECNFSEDSCTKEESDNNEIAISLNEGIVKNHLSGKTYKLIGVFSHYDFQDTPDEFDWVFKDSNGFYSQLMGNESSDTNVFGWKYVQIDTEPAPNWYMFPLDEDLDGAGSKKFDWIIVSADYKNKQVYKLSGVTDKGTFKYSKNINIMYNLNYERSEIIFSEIRPGETKH